MLISLCSVLYDLTGDLVFDASEKSDFSYLSRRITRTATLDGGCFIADSGFSASDGTIKIIITATQNSPELTAQIAQLIKKHGMVTVSCKEGIFLAAFKSVANAETSLTLDLLIKSQLA